MVTCSVAADLNFVGTQVTIGATSLEFRAFLLKNKNKTPKHTKLKTSSLRPSFLRDPRTYWCTDRVVIP
jgi:hypothetical protein